jgi:hypothetical protein
VLSSALKSILTLMHLDLGANKIEHGALHALARLLQQCSTLRVLELSGRAVSDEVAALMGCILKTTSLTSLSVTVPSACVLPCLPLLTPCTGQTASRKGAAHIVEHATALKSLQLSGEWAGSTMQACLGTAPSSVHCTCLCQALMDIMLIFFHATQAAQRLSFSRGRGESVANAGACSAVEHFAHLLTSRCNHSRPQNQAGLFRQFH